MSIDTTNQQNNEKPYTGAPHMDASSIVLLTNPDNQLHQFELTLRGLMIDSEGNTYSIGEPLMNNKGINTILGIVKAVVSQVTILSNLDKNGIWTVMDLFADALAKDLMVNRMHYGIKSISARDVVYFEALANGYICLRRAYEGDDKRFWKGSVMEYIQRFDGSPDRKKSLFSKVLGGG